MSDPDGSQAQVCALCQGGGARPRLHLGLLCDRCEGRVQTQVHNGGDPAAALRLLAGRIISGAANEVAKDTR